MKIEKMGEKKEEFLEKLEECYSISTKNGTLTVYWEKGKFTVAPRSGGEAKNMSFCTHKGTNRWR